MSKDERTAYNRDFESRYVWIIELLSVARTQLAAVPWWQKDKIDRYWVRGAMDALYVASLISSSPLSERLLDLIEKIEESLKYDGRKCNDILHAVDGEIFYALHEFKDTWYIDVKPTQSGAK